MMKKVDTASVLRIRCISFENQMIGTLIVVVEKTDYVNASFGCRFLHFVPLSYVPIQASMCVKEMLEEWEKKWLQEYNQECVDRMKPLIHDEKVLEWLQRQADEATELYECLFVDL